MNPNRIAKNPELASKLDNTKKRQLGRIVTEDLWEDGIAGGFYDTLDETTSGRSEVEENLDPETIARRQTIATLERPLEEEFKTAQPNQIESPFVDDDYDRAMNGDAEAKERVEALREWVADVLRAQEETLARQQERMHISEERKARTAELAKKIYRKIKIGVLAMAGAAALFLAPAQIVDESIDSQAQTTPYKAMAAEKIDTSSETFMIPDMVEPLFPLADEETEPLSPLTGEETEPITEEVIEPILEDVTESAPEGVTEPVFDGAAVEAPIEPEVQHVEDDNTWDGPVINAVNGTVEGPSGKETYYNLPMQGVVDIMRGMGNNDEYWVREDGCKMLGDYIMVAADLNIHPRGSLVPTSRGMGIVCDTGEFIYSNPQQLDIATSW